MFKELSIVITVCLSQTAIAQTDTIKFHLTDHNNISIEAVFNEADTLNLMFHTAAGDVALIKDATQNLNGIKWDSETTVQSWGGESHARYSASNLVQIGNYKTDSISIWEDERSGPGTDGKFGPDLFGDKIIEIDFDERILILHEKLPIKAEDYEKIPLISENGFMFIEGISTIEDKDYQNRFLIHSGYGGAILYDDQFAKDSRIGEHVEIIKEEELKDSYGNILKTKQGKLPKFIVGDEEFTDIPVGFFEGSIARQQMSVMGGNLLKRFNLIFDAERTHVYMKANSLKELPYVKS